MKAVHFTRHGNPPDVVEVVDLETGAPAEDEAVIAVEATPVNPADLLRISGGYGAPTPLPAVPGAEGVGRVVEVGSAVTGIEPGQRVLLPLGGGAWRQQMRARAASLVPVPEEADPLQLAMAMVNPPTAYLMLTSFVELREGDWVVQNAANSAVGRHLIRLAKRRGLKTVNVVRREGLAASLKKLGADVVIGDGPDLGQRIAAETGNADIALALDAVGGEATERLAGALAEGGTVVNYGLLSGEPCRIPAALTVFKDIRLRGFWLVRWLRQASREDRAALYGELVGLIMNRTLHTEVEATYPLARVKEALGHALAGGRSGKILLLPAEAEPR